MEYIWIITGFAAALLLILILWLSISQQEQIKYPPLNSTPKPSDANLTYYYTVNMNNGAIIDVNGDPYVIYQTIYSPLAKDSTLQTKIGTYNSATTISNINEYITCVRDSSNCSLSPFVTKSGIAVLSINDGNKSGTISYVLNNNPTVIMENPSNYIQNSPTLLFPFYFPNKSGDPNVYDIVGGTGFFLGKKGYVYIFSASDVRTVYIYYK